MKYRIPDALVAQARAMLDDGCSLNQVATHCDISLGTVKKIKKDDDLAIGQMKSAVAAAKAHHLQVIQKTWSIFVEAVGSITAKELQVLKKKDMKKFIEVLEKYQKIYRLETDQSTDNKSYHYTVMSTVRDRLDDQMFTPD